MKPAFDAATDFGDTILIHAGDYEVDSFLSLSEGVTLQGVKRDSSRILFVETLNLWQFGRAYGYNDISALTFALSENSVSSGLNQTATTIVVAEGWLRVHDCRFVGLKISKGSSGEFEVYDNIFDLQGNYGCHILNAEVGDAVIHDNLFLGGTGPTAGGSWGCVVTHGTAFIYNNIFDFSDTGTRGLPILVIETNFPVTIRNNLIMGGQGGIWWFRTDGVVENNTFVGPDKTFYLEGNTFYQSPSQTLSVRNNIFYYTSLPLFGGDGATTGPIWYYHNAIWPPSDSTYRLNPDPFHQVATILDSANLNLYPMFLDDSLYHLQAGSPLIDGGAPSILDVDSSHSDIGWYGGPGGASYEYLDVAPLAPESLSVQGTDGLVSITWSSRPEADLADYRLFRCSVSDCWKPGIEPHRVIPQPDTNVIDTILIAGESYFYVVTAIDTALNESAPSPEDSYTVTGVKEDNDLHVLPRSPTIMSVYPNPFNETTIVNVFNPNSTSGETPLALEFYNVLGRVVRRIDLGQIDSGEHQITWNARDDHGSQLSSGVYLAVLKGSNFTDASAQKLVLLK